MVFIESSFVNPFELIVFELLFYLLPRFAAASLSIHKFSTIQGRNHYPLAAYLPRKHLLLSAMAQPAS
jgi:hypothetical protein